MTYAEIQELLFKTAVELLERASRGHCEPEARTVLLAVSKKLPESVKPEFLLDCWNDLFAGTHPRLGWGFNAANCNPPWFHVRAVGVSPPTS
jgi:hypothetical protein